MIPIIDKHISDAFALDDSTDTEAIYQFPPSPFPPPLSLSWELYINHDCLVAIVEVPCLWVST